MNKLTKLSIVLSVLAIAALLIAGGGLLAMVGLRLPTTTMLPQPVSFAMLMVPVLGLSSGAAMLLGYKRQRA